MNEEKEKTDTEWSEIKGYRRLFIIRKDLELSPGKLAAQVAHCAEAYWLKLIRSWEDGQADGAARFRIARQAAGQHLTVRETEVLVQRAQKRLPTPPQGRRVISLVRDQRLYVNAIKSVFRQMRDTGLDAQMETAEEGEWLEMRIRIKKSIV